MMASCLLFTGSIQQMQIQQFESISNLLSAWNKKEKDLIYLKLLGIQFSNYFWASGN